MLPLASTVEQHSEEQGGDIAYLVEPGVRRCIWKNLRPEMSL